MADTYGGLPFPIPAGDFGATARDPALEAICSYLTAVIQSKCSVAWAAIAPGEKAVVASAWWTHPDHVLLNPGQLPALFVWRGRATRTRLSDDILRAVTPLNILWLLYRQQAVKREIWAPFQVSVANVIHASLAKGRDPAWVVAGDTTANAATRGSVLIKQAGIEHEIADCMTEEVPITLSTDGGEPQVHRALSVTCEIIE